MNENKVMVNINERVEIQSNDFNIDSLQDSEKIESLLRFVDSSITKMLIPGSTIILSLSTSRGKKEKRLTNYIEIDKYNNDTLKKVLHNKLKKAIENGFNRKDRGYKIVVWYEAIISYPYLYRGTSLSF